jgi:histidyl-tRNA synthetase
VHPPPARPTNSQVSFDLSLARGLDYYTGLIFEVITSASAPPPPARTPATKPRKSTTTPDDDVSESVGVGSICGGGRYDELVSRFAGDARQIPCIGLSVGIERVFTILKGRCVKGRRVRPSETQVYVMGMGDVGLEPRLCVVRELWRAGIKVAPPSFLPD